jgi:hypothetical protein
LAKLLGIINDILKRDKDNKKNDKIQKKKEKRRWEARKDKHLFMHSLSKAYLAA